jgi:predicted CoA-binding protein
MSRTPDTISTLRDVLGRCRTIAVVGLSPQWHRPSYFAAKYMQAHGYRIVPVNPVVAQRAAASWARRCFASVSEAAQAVARRAGASTWWTAFARAKTSHRWPRMPSPSARSCLWLQLGVVNEDAAGAPKTRACRSSRTAA